MALLEKCPLCKQDLTEDEREGSWQWCRNPAHHYWHNGLCSCPCGCELPGSRQGPVGPVCIACATKKCLAYQKKCQCPCGCDKPAVKTVIFKTKHGIFGGALCADCIAGRHAGG